MVLKEMRYVLAVHEHNSFTKAAESLYISQPALSKYIKNLEESLGAKLFEKQGSKFVLTYSGKLYVEAARTIMNVYDTLEMDLSSSVDGQRGKLRVGTTTFRGSHLFPKILPAFHRRYPNVEIELFEESAQRLEQHLSEGVVDLIIVKLPVMLPNISYIPLYEEQLLLSVPPDNPHVGRAVRKEGQKYPWIDLQYFRDEIFIMLKPTQRTRQISDEILLREGIEPKQIIETNNVETAVRLSSSLGVSFIPELFTIGGYASSMPLFFSIGDPVTTCTFVAAHRKKRYLTGYAKDFLNMVIHYYGEAVHR